MDDEINNSYKRPMISSLSQKIILEQLSRKRFLGCIFLSVLDSEPYAGFLESNRHYHVTKI